MPRPPALGPGAEPAGRSTCRGIERRPSGQVLSAPDVENEPCTSENLKGTKVLRWGW